MMAEVKIRNLMNPPPGGVFFYEHDGERIEAKYWFDMEPRMLDLMRRHLLVGDPARMVAEQMCPQMPDWYCTGAIAGTDVVRTDEARRNSAAYFNKPTVAFDEISRRLQTCVRCPRHQRKFCMTCTGILDWIQAGFGGRRTRVPEDRLSGVCTCARALESAIAAVDYGESSPAWDDTPDTCWRSTR